MKKITVFAIAIASMAMALTSCDKEENAFTREIKVSIEQNEANNAAKTFIVDNGAVSNVYWNNGDTLCIYDQKGNGNIYLAQLNGEDCTFIFNTKKTSKDMDETSNNLFAYYPVRFGTAYASGTWMRLPRKQNSVSGEFNDYPMFAQGPINNLRFKNVCGIIRFNLTGNNVRIDSIAISTEKTINGSFNTNYTATDNILTDRGGLTYGTNEIVLHMSNGALATSAGTVVNMYMLPGTYEIFNVTFFSNGNAYTLRNVNPVTIQRSAINTFDRELDATKFIPTVYGTTNALFSVGTLGNAYIAKGNLMFVGGQGSYDPNGHSWNLHTFGFDGIGNGSYISNTYGVSASFQSTDIYAWGANGYYLQNGSLGLKGNKISIHLLSLKAWNAFPWKKNITTSLSSGDDKACNAKVNADNTLAWSTPTEAQMQEILDNNEHKMITLSFLNGRTTTGMVIVPATSTLALSAIPETVTTKSQWNAIEKAGCAFLPVLYHRGYTTNQNTSWNSSTICNRTYSYYQLADSKDADYTPALKLETTGESFEDIHKGYCTSVRPIVMVSAPVAE